MTTLIILILVALVVTLGYTTINLLFKVEKLEETIENQVNILSGYMTYLNKMSEIIDFSSKKLKEVDARETFKSDDEIGFFFQQLQAIQEILDKFNIKNL